MIVLSEKSIESLVELAKFALLSKFRISKKKKNFLNFFLC